MVYALFTAISSFLTGKIYLAYFPRYVVAIFTTLITLSLAIFLVIWERQPSYVFVFTFIAVWGIVAGQWITLAPSKLIKQYLIDACSVYFMFAVYIVMYIGNSHLHI